MKRILSLLTLIWVTFTFAQTESPFKIVEPVKWTSNIEKVSDTEYNLVFKANIEDQWHLYSQYNPDGASFL